MGTPATNPGWINASILVGAGLFICALVVSAIFDPSIRVLHALQALIYVAVIILTRRGSSWGFGAGCFIAAFWNYTNLFVTTFIRAGLGQLMTYRPTGQLHRPDLVVAVIAAAGHFLMIVVAALEPDRTHSRLAMSDANAEAEFEAAALPSWGEVTHRLPHRYCHPDCPRRWVGAGYGGIEQHHEPVTDEPLQRALETVDKRPQGGMVFVEHAHHLLGPSALGKRGEAAQVAEDKGDLAAVARQQSFAAAWRL